MPSPTFDTTGSVARSVVRSSVVVRGLPLLTITLFTTSLLAPQSGSARSINPSPSLSTQSSHVSDVVGGRSPPPVMRTLPSTGGPPGTASPSGGALKTTESGAKPIGVQTAEAPAATPNVTSTTGPAGNVGNGTCSFGATSTGSVPAAGAGAVAGDSQPPSAA